MEEKRSDFTSEIFKIELTNLPKFGFGEMKKFLKKLNLNAAKVKAVQKNQSSGPRMQIAYICFRSEDERTEALDKLNGHKWKGRSIEARPSKALIDPMHKIRLENTKPVQAKSCLEATAPLASLPYEEQLTKKSDEIVEILKNYGNEISKTNRNLHNLMKAKFSDNDGLPCKWLGVKGSPQILGYRNKSEFSIGKNSNGEKVVGFRVGSYADGSVEVASVDSLPHIPDQMKLAAKLFQKYVQTSNFDVFNPEIYQGQFRQLTVRCSQSTGEIMLIIGIYKEGVEDQIDAFKDDLRNYFTEKEGKELNVTSLYTQYISKSSSGEHNFPTEHIHGNLYITEQLMGLKFRVSPTSFFQINASATEILYQSAIDMAKPTENTTLLDICCGTGSIGLCFSKHCGHVLGVELNEDAIRDAKFNAENNNITNCTFYAGNCDDYIDTMIRNATTNDVLAVIDPPRAGLHRKSIISLRSARGLNRFVYISCSPKSALRNWVDLGRETSKAYRGNPFVPIAAIGVDMFPHTKHMELALLFERIDINSKVESE